MPDAVPDPSDSLESLVAILSPLFEERCYKGGAYLAREGQAADSLIYIEEGAADICFSMRQRPDEDLLDDEEEVSVPLPPGWLQGGFTIGRSALGVPPCSSIVTNVGSSRRSERHCALSGYHWNELLTVILGSRN